MMLGFMALLLLGCSGEGGESTPFLRRGETRHLGRLTGSVRNPMEDVGLRGTDLGVSFPCGGRLCFLFGDSMMRDPSAPGSGAYDAMAFGPLDWPGSAGEVALDWLKDASGRFKPLEAPGLSLGTMEVPVEGITVKDKVYIFFDSGWDTQEGRHQYSALTHVVDPDTWELALDYRVPSEKFINISAESVQTEGDWEPWIYLWGTGLFRKSPVYLARVRASGIADRSAYRYYQGTGPEGPVFGTNEEKASPLFEETGIGELSVTQHEQLDCWLMTYNISNPVRVNLRTAPTPYGPWSAPIAIFKPWKDGGYTAFIHARRDRMGYDDGLSDPGREEEWGGSYGPYLIPSYFRHQKDGCFVIVYTLSSWNPYQVHLMETELLTSDFAGRSPMESKNSPGPGPSLMNGDFGNGDLDGWTVEGDAHSLAPDDERGYRLTSSTNIWQDFQVGADVKHLKFLIYNGFGSVKLLRDGALLRRTFGPGRGRERITTQWNLIPLQGKRVRLLIEGKGRIDRELLTTSGFRLVGD